jgi:RNA polymerase sigma-70 factor (ECF subfamily)
MGEENFLADAFERHRGHLRSVAYRMLGSASEADDAVQEAWIRLARAEGGSIDNLGGWLTTVVARQCLDMLRSRKSRREEPLDEGVPEPAAEPTGHEAMLADSIGAALLVVLDRLGPAERVAFVLHDMFDLPFGDIAAIVERSPLAARQLASRARRRVQGAAPRARPDTTRQREIVDAFLAASRSGDLTRLIALLAPDVVFRADARAVAMGGQPELRGADAVASAFKGRAQAARMALIDGRVGVAVAFHGATRIALLLEFRGDRIAGIEAVADPDRLAALAPEVL